MNFLFETILYWVFEIVLNWGTKSARRQSTCSFLFNEFQRPPMLFSLTFHWQDQNHQTISTMMLTDSNLFDKLWYKLSRGRKETNSGDLSQSGTGILSSSLILSLKNSSLHFEGLATTAFWARQNAGQHHPRSSAWRKHGASNAALFSQLPGLPVWQGPLFRSNRVSKIIKLFFFPGPTKSSMKRVWAS